MPECSMIYPEEDDPQNKGLCHLTVFPVAWPVKRVEGMYHMLDRGRVGMLYRMVKYDNDHNFCPCRSFFAYVVANALQKWYMYIDVDTFCRTKVTVGKGGLAVV